MRWILAAVVVLAIGLAVVLVVAIVPFARPIRQPVAFNHRVHLEGVGLECVDCHTHAVDGVRATIPPIDVCATCHSEAQGTTAAEGEVVAHVAAGTPIPWVQVHAVPDHVYFSHRRHAAMGRIDCEVCHGNVRARVRPFARPGVRPRMAWCTGCHQSREVRIDCIACHR